jgi:alpha-mannosidase
MKEQLMRKHSPLKRAHSLVIGWSLPALSAALPLLFPAHASADLSTDDTLYSVATAHLDTQWNWTIQETINSYIKDTLEKNFAFFAETSHYRFNFEGAFRYQLAKEYYPELYAQLKEYVEQGRWSVAGSSWESGDVNVPSPEAIFRNILYGNQFFKNEFQKSSVDIFLPDCFGFGYALPSIAAHAGLLGFSTQKLEGDWHSAHGVPFDIGRWIGPDGASIAAAIKPGGYGTDLSPDWIEDQDIQGIIDANGVYGVRAAYRYYGDGDVGGAPEESSVDLIEQAIEWPTGSIDILSASSDQIFRDMTPEQVAGLPSYDGELVLTTHGTGSYTSKAISKRWNRKNELLADAAERASVLAEWFGGAPYPAERLREAWQRFIWHTFHDDLTGTSIPEAYTFSWNDYVLSLNQFAGELANGVGAVSRVLDTRAQGTPIVVYNPLSVSRDDIVEARVHFPGGVPSALRVYDPSGTEVASQIQQFDGEYATILFRAVAPPMAYQTYDVRAASSPSTVSTGLSITAESLVSNRYQVSLDSNGDISSVYDRLWRRELLSSPIRLQMLDDSPDAWPAWEISYEDISAHPREYVGGTPVVTIIENGPARVALRVTRKTAGSTVSQVIRLSAGQGARVEVENDVRWQTKATLLKAAFPLAASNPEATYDLGLGTISRPNNTSSLYEVPAQQWADLTDPNGSYGVSILNDSKYGWDKPNDNTLRMTLIHTPLDGFGGSAQDVQDMGRNRFTYAIYGHYGAWSSASTVWQAARLNQPLMAFQTTPHRGSIGKSYSFLSISKPSQVAVKAMKKAEDTNEIIVRVQEISGRSATGVLLSMGNGISGVREVNAQEEALPTTATLENAKLRFDLLPYQPKTFAVTLTRPAATVAPPSAQSLILPFNKDVVSFDDGRSDGAFDVRGRTIPGELFPSRVMSEGILFNLGPTANGQNNALYADGQSFSLPSGARRLYLLAASANGDRAARFTVGSTPVDLTIRDYRAPVGQWDNFALGTLASIKRDPVALLATHTHVPGENRAYEFAQLFKYRIDLPTGSNVVRLPRDPSIVILAMTASDNANDDTVPAGDLYDAVAPPDVGPDLAFGKTATGSEPCDPSEGPANAVDGLTNTKWCSKKDTRYLTIDLGTPQQVERFILRHAGAGGEGKDLNTRDFSIDVSTNGSQWTTVVTVTGNTSHVTTHAIPSTSARYVRLNVTGPTSTDDPAARIYEIEVYRTKANLALGTSATGSTPCNQAEGAQNAVDGSNSTKWCSSASSRWLQIDLGEVRPVNEFVLRHAGAGGEDHNWNTKDFEIETSTDGSAWTDAVNVTGNTADVTTHSIAPTSARYVRLNVITPTSNGDNAARIYEFEVYGSGNQALGKTATSTAACAANEGPEKAVDGLYDTKWCSLADPSWWQVDLGTTASLEKIVVRHAGSGGESIEWNTEDFSIEASSDGNSWETVVSVIGNTDDVTTHPVPGTWARYVRLNPITPTCTTDAAARIYEIEVYGEVGPLPTGCDNDVQDGDETDIDCGGSDCEACDTGLRCSVNLDCKSDNCSGGVCRVPGEPVAVNLRVSDDWGTGYCAHVMLTNHATRTTSNWSVTIDAGESTTYDTWNGLFWGDTGIIVVRPEFDWNQKVAPGATDQTVGFCANRTPPTSGALPVVLATSATY